MPRPSLFVLACAFAAGLCTFAAMSEAQDDAAAPAGEMGAAEQPAAATSAETPEAAATAAPVDAQTTNDRSYALGFVVGSQYRRGNVQLDPDQFAEGMRTGLSGGESRLSEEQIQQILGQFEQQLRAQQMARIQQQAQAGQQFLTENSAKQGVQKTETGLQYQVEAEGQGQSPAATDTVKVHYRGTLVDGTQFDSSYDRGEPATFRVNEVIPGWTEALQLMKPGAKYKLTIPPDLAYGQSGRPPVIPPNSVLLFDVELLEVNPAQQ